MNGVTHGGIREAIRNRIVAGEWKLGELIPGEMEFAAEYECSRTTVNRALQALADEGIVERKRKGGTRVRPMPAPQAQLKIPIIREQVESRDAAYSVRIVRRQTLAPTEEIAQLLGLGQEGRCAYLETLHLSDERPFVFERRWVNLGTVPDFEEADLDQTSANEWLIRTVPFTRGDVSLCATSADAKLASVLGVEQGEALFTMKRVTWLGQRSVTATRLYYAPGYSLDFAI